MSLRGLVQLEDYEQFIGANAIERIIIKGTVLFNSSFHSLCLSCQLKRTVPFIALYCLYFSDR